MLNFQKVSIKFLIMAYSPGYLLKEVDFQDVVGAFLLNNQAI